MKKVPSGNSAKSYASENSGKIVAIRDTRSSQCIALYRTDLEIASLDSGASDRRQKYRQSSELQRIFIAPHAEQSGVHDIERTPAVVVEPLCGDGHPVSRQIERRVSPSIKHHSGKRSRKQVSRYRLSRQACLNALDVPAPRDLYFWESFVQPSQQCGGGSRKADHRNNEHDRGDMPAHQRDQADTDCCHVRQ